MKQTIAPDWEGCSARSMIWRCLAGHPCNYQDHNQTVRVRARRGIIARLRHETLDALRPEVLALVGLEKSTAPKTLTARFGRYQTGFEPVAPADRTVH